MRLFSYRNSGFGREKRTVCFFADGRATQRGKHTPVEAHAAPPRAMHTRPPFAAPAVQFRTPLDMFIRGESSRSTTTSGFFDMRACGAPKLCALLVVRACHRHTTYHTDTHTPPAPRDSICRGVCAAVSLVSGLDAVSRYPPRDSVAAPDGRPTTHARDATRGFLSYYIVLLSTNSSIED